MNVAVSHACMVLMGLAASMLVQAAGCPVSRPGPAPEGAPWSSSDSSSGWAVNTHGWYGDGDLAALIPVDGHWTGMGRERNFADKFWWWRRGYDALTESNPKLFISASRLDGFARPFVMRHVTNGFGDDWSAMLVGMEFPAPGCWQVVGRYQGHELKIVLQVGDG